MRHILSDLCIDETDIIFRKNSLSGQIYNILCYFINCNSAYEQSVTNAYLSNLYGCELWDLNYPALQCVYKMENEVQNCLGSAIGLPQ